MTYSWTPPGEYNSFLQYCRNLYGQDQGQDKSSLLLLFGGVPPGSRAGCPDPGVLLYKSDGGAGLTFRGLNSWLRNQFWFETLLNGNFVEDWRKENFVVLVVFA